MAPLIDGTGPRTARGTLLAGSLALALAGPARAADPFPAISYRPQRIVTLGVIDADTVLVPSSRGPATAYRMRLLGIDAPEMRSSCAAERQKAVEARDRLAELVRPGAFALNEMDFDGYGRPLGRVFLRDGREAAMVLIAERKARPLGGNEARKPWCDAAGALLPLPAAP